MLEKPPMINKRAFFPSIYSRLDHSIYVFGGNDQGRDLNDCEKFSLAENVWRPIAPMKTYKNGSAATIFDDHRLIFTFGGNVHKQGSINRIEKYEIDFDKWLLLSIQMKNLIHDLQLFNIGHNKVLIFGGHTNSEQNKEIEIIDLSLACLKTQKGNLTLKKGGKSYFQPIFSQQKGVLSMVFGYCDEKP